MANGHSGRVAIVVVGIWELVTDTSIPFLPRLQSWLLMFDYGAASCLRTLPTGICSSASSHCQMDFIKRDQLIEVMTAWALMKSKSLGSVLVERAAMKSVRAIRSKIREEGLMRDMGAAADTLTRLSKQMLEQPMFGRPAKWSEPFIGQTPGSWDGNWLGVYVLWGNQDDLKNGIPPVYIGEGGLGNRIWESFQRANLQVNPREWNYVQFLKHDQISGSDREHTRWRLALEHFLIVLLEPEANLR